MARTYTNTPEPRYVEKANKTNELPAVTAADAGKAVGVTAEGKIGLIDGTTVQYQPVPGEPPSFVSDYSILKTINGNIYPVIFFINDSGTLSGITASVPTYNEDDEYIGPQIQEIDLAVKPDNRHCLTEYNVSSQTHVILLKAGVGITDNITGSFSSLADLPKFVNIVVSSTDFSTIISGNTYTFTMSVSGEGYTENDEADLIITQGTNHIRLSYLANDNGYLKYRGFYYANNTAYIIEASYRLQTRVFTATAHTI